MPPASFDPATYPALVALGQKLKEHAGEAAYNAGRELALRQAIRDATIVGTTATAVVTGSTQYEVTIAFSRRAKSAKVGCTCPASRRSRLCKHIVAVSVLLLEQPGAFIVRERASVPKPPQPRQSRPARAKSDPEAERAAQREAGLALVDRLLEELAASGAAGLDTEGISLLRSTAEAVRVLKLRRLGNALMALSHLIARGEADAHPGQYAMLLQEIWLARQLLGAHIEQRANLDSTLVGSLIGKTWRASELPRIGPLELVGVASDAADDGEFEVDSRYFCDVASGALYVERQITPCGIRKRPMPIRRLRLLVAEAAVYPGMPPHRIQILQAERAALRPSDIERVLDHAATSVDSLMQQLHAWLALPFTMPQPLVLFRPAALYVQGSRIIATDSSGHAVAVAWPPSWTRQVQALLPLTPGRYALAGLVGLAPEGPELHCLAVTGDLRWQHGPVFPDFG
jgi:hypothetical protein